MRMHGDNGPQKRARVIATARPSGGGRAGFGPAIRVAGRLSSSAVRVAALAAILCAAIPINALGARVNMGGVLPVGDLAQKTVESVRERKYANLVEQKTDFSCGAAALATILRYGYNVEGATEERVLEGLFAVADEDKVREKGFSLLDLKHFVEQYGYRGRGYRVDAGRLDALKIPTIALLDIDGYRHFVVLRAVDNGRAFVADPALGNRAMPIDEFAAAWNGIVFAVIGTAFDDTTVLLDPGPTISARRLHDIYAPVPRAETIGYGLRHTELF